MAATHVSSARRRAAPVWALLALALASTAAAATRPRAEDAAAAVARVLATTSAGAGQTADLAAELAAVGPDAVAPLLEALGGELLLEAPLHGPRREAALEALARLPRARVLSALAEVSRSEERTVAGRVACLEVLGRVAEAGEVGMLLRMGAPGPQEPRQPEVERAFEQALGELLDRRPQLCEPVAGQMREADPSLLVPLVRQLARARTPGQVELLADQLGRVPGADVLLLGEIERAAPKATLAVARRVRPRVRSLVGSADVLTCLAACRAVAALEDPAAVEALITLLGADQQALQAAALDALERLTQRRLGPEPAPWSDWYAAELAWWRGEAQRELLAVRRAAPRELAPAVMGLARGRLFREEIAPALTPLLGHADPDLARLAASVLSTLGSRAALPALADALAHADPAVADGAHKALRRITGRDLGPDPDAWLALPH